MSASPNARFRLNSGLKQRLERGRRLGVEGLEDRRLLAGDLFITRESNDPSNLSLPTSDLISIDPFSTAQGDLLTQQQGYELGDIAFRPDNQLLGYSKDVRGANTNSPQDALSGKYVQMDTLIGNTSVLGSSSITTSEYKTTGATDSIQAAHLNAGTRVGYGVQFEALSFGDYGANLTQDLIAIGNRGENYGTDAISGQTQLVGNRGTNRDISPQANLVYQLNPQNGQSLVNGGPMHIGSGVSFSYTGALTSAFEVGEISTNSPVLSADATTYNSTSKVTTSNVRDGNSFTVATPAGQQVFQFDAGAEVKQAINTSTGNTIRDGNFFILDPDSDAQNNNETWFQFDTGRVIAVNTSSSSIPDGESFSISDSQGHVSVFEFDRNGTQSIAGSVLIDIKAFLSSSSIASLMANAMNAEFSAGHLNVQATAAATRVSLLNDTSVTLSTGLTSSALMALSGAPGAAPILQAVPGNQITDGQTFTVSRFNQLVRTFEFDNDFKVTLGNIRVAFDASMAAQAIANAMNSSLQALGSTVTIQQVGTRIVLDGIGTGGDPATGNNLYSQGTSPIVNLLTTKTVVSIPTEEFHAADDVVVSATQTIPGVGSDVSTAVAAARFTAGHFQDRLNFAPFANANSLPVVTADFSGVPVWTVNSLSATGVSGGAVAVPFLASDKANDISQRMTDVMNVTFNDPGFSRPSANRVIIQRSGQFSTVDLPLTLEKPNAGPGGFITGSVIMSTSSLSHAALTTREPLVDPQL